MIAALLGGTAAASAAPSPGDAGVRRALTSLGPLDTSGHALLFVLLMSDGDGVDGAVGYGRGLRAGSVHAARTIRATSPTTPQGRRMKALGIRAARIHAEAARMTVATQRAIEAGHVPRSDRFLSKALRLHRTIDALTATAMGIVLPDPTAAVATVSLVGVVSVPSAEDLQAPIVAGAGGVMSRCSDTDYGVGWRIYALGVRGTSLLTFTTTAPDGSTSRTVERIAPSNEGVEGIQVAKAHGDGVYRLVVTRGTVALLDVSVTRACR